MQGQGASDLYGLPPAGHAQIDGGFRNNLSTAMFPVTNTRVAGVSPSISHSISLIDSMTPEELNRHQQSANGPTRDDPYNRLRVGTFPLPGARPGRAGPDGMPERDSFMENRPTAAATMRSTSSQSQSRSQPQPGARPESFDSFLREMPTSREDPTRHVMFTELIRLKTKTLELQIAEARQKEREAELELARFKTDIERFGQGQAQGQLQVQGQHMSRDGSGTGQNGTQINTNPFINNQPNAVGLYPIDNQINPSMSNPGPTGTMPNLGQATVPENAPTPMTTFDLEAMMHDANIDNLFSWLPEYNPTDGQQQRTIDPSGLFLPNIPLNTLPNPPQQTHNDSIHTSPSLKKRSPSPSSETSSPPPTKRTKRTTEKKTVVEKHSNCIGCSHSVGKILIRAPKSQIPDQIHVQLSCTSCVPLEVPSQLPDHPTLGSAIGTVDMRKRMRVSMEIDDEEKGLKDRRAFCDVCQRVVASGRIIGGKDGEVMSHIAEIVCSACDAKYQRCTDCGGGGGPRVGIGKWRMKQVFQPGRKTCGLSHSRLGDRPREIGVHVTPTDFTEEQLKEVLTRTKGLWHEKTLTRLAVPEMLEIDLPPETINPLQDFADVEDLITRNWPTREAMICAKDVDGGRFQRLLGLTWAHAKPRRTVRSVDIEEEYAKTAEHDDEADMSTVLANVKRTNIVIPPGSELVGMWGGEWDMEQGSLLISTLIPFEGADGEDSTALSVGEMITKVQALRQAMNSEREAIARSQGRTPDLLPQCEHLWVVSGGTMPLVRERVADVLIRKRSFVHVEEYLTRHPEFKHALEARPYGLHPDLHRPIKGNPEEEEEVFQTEPLILVRWLGKDFDAQKILEIKQQEFGGGKTKLKKKSKGK